MVTIAESGVDFFGKEMPSLKEIKRLSSFVNSGESASIKFREELEASKDREKIGIGSFILGESRKAVEFLKDAETKQGLMYLGFAYSDLKDAENAASAFDKAASAGAESITVTLAKAEAYRLALQFEQAKKILDDCKNLEKVSAEYHFQIARLFDSQGNYQEAIENYEQAIELDENHSRAMFHLAYACDLRGDEEAAIDYYKQITSGSPVFVSAIMNLAVLYEDQGKFAQARRCVEAVLKSHPNHKKAQLFLKDIKSSMNMIYDEEMEKRLDRQNKILEIPISDFELSVRSRNCLRKMNIKTIGDLLRITEAELLSYKNFGETSLNEIKKILDSKGLSLGMALENGGAPEQTDQELPEGADQEMLGKSVEDLELSVRSRRCLSRLGIRSIGDLISKTEAELLGCKNFGVTSLNEIKERLTNQGLNLRTLE